LAPIKNIFKNISQKGGIFLRPIETRYGLPASVNLFVRIAMVEQPYRRKFLSFARVQR
jgi:hypothetical protein